MRAGAALAATIAAALAATAGGAAVDAGARQGGTPEYEAAQFQDVNAPETKILRTPDARSFKHRAKFKFGTTEPAGAVFMCSRDGRPYYTCDSPLSFRVGPGRHNFKVFSIDFFGNVDATPAEDFWRVLRQK